MRNNVGIFNSQNYINEYMRGLRQAATHSPARLTIESYAERIAGRYEAWLHVIAGAQSFDSRLVAKGERLAREYETQMTLLAEYADEEAGM